MAAYADRLPIGSICRMLNTKANEGKLNDIWSFRFELGLSILFSGAEFHWVISNALTEGRIEPEYAALLAAYWEFDGAAYRLEHIQQDISRTDGGRLRRFYDRGYTANNLWVLVAVGCFIRDVGCITLAIRLEEITEASAFYDGRVWRSGISCPARRWRMSWFVGWLGASESANCYALLSSRHHA
ncbi:MAG: hypothetical protein ACLSB7_11080 [Parabacteroides distasonis]